MRAPVQPLVLTSADWQTATFALYEGEIAWEITPARTWYMLRGDGEPINGGASTSYTRLRVNANSYIVNITDFPSDATWLETVATIGDLPSQGLDPAVRYFCKVSAEKKFLNAP